MWAVAIHLYKVKLPWMQIVKITFISTLAALTAHYIAVQFAPLWGILLGGTASLIVLFGLFYLMRVLETEDRSRLNTLTGMLPKNIGEPANKIMSLLIRPELVSAPEKSLL
jgi:energy-converting hydrogenase Eha subunit C